MQGEIIMNLFPFKKGTGKNGLFIEEVGEGYVWVIRYHNGDKISSRPVSDPQALIDLLEHSGRGFYPIKDEAK